MNTYCKKKTTVRKRENVFDAILESNSPFLPSTEADEDARYGAGFLLVYISIQTFLTSLLSYAVEFL